MIDSSQVPATPRNRQQEIVDAALDDPTVPKIYANGFMMTVTNADLVIVLQVATRPKAVLNMSYTLAKTLQERLGRAIAEFEAKTGRTMLTTDNVDRAFSLEQPK